MENWTTEQLKTREQELASEVAESETALNDPDSYVSRKCLAADKRTLKAIRKILTLRARFDYPMNPS